MGYHVDVSDKLLRKLAEKDLTRYGDLRQPDKDQALAELAAAGLVVESKVGRTRTFSLTPEGRERAAALPPEEKPAPRRRAPVGGAAGGAGGRDDRLERIEAALARIEAALARLVPPDPAEPAKLELRPVLLETIAALDDERRYGGLVPLPELRRSLRARGVTASDGEVNAALEALERDFVVDLSIAQSPTTVTERSAGIERPGRGLAYFVVRRQG